MPRSVKCWISSDNWTCIGTAPRHLSADIREVCISVVILALSPRKSRQIANKGFMIYYGRYRSQLAILKSPKENSCSNLLSWRKVSPPGVHKWLKNGVMAYLCYKQTNFSNVFSNCQRTIPGWLTLFYMSLFLQNGEIQDGRNALAIMIEMTYLHQ